MVQDRQVRRLFMLKQKEETLGAAAAKAGLDEKTARKYLRLGRLPSQVRAPHTWRTRPDAYAEVWDDKEIESRMPHLGHHKAEKYMSPSLIEARRQAEKNYSASEEMRLWMEKEKGMSRIIKNG